MGADGGVCYVPLRDPSKKPRAMELLRAFYPLFTCPWKRGCAAEQTDEWERAHPEIASSKNYLMGYYGDFGAGIDLGDLAEMFRYYHDFDELVPDPSLTFEELLFDLATRPMGYPGSTKYLGRWQEVSCQDIDINGRWLSPIEVLLWRCFGWEVEATSEKILLDAGDTSLDPIRNMKVVDWAREVERLCRWGSFIREETWT